MLTSKIIQIIDLVLDNEKEGIGKGTSRRMSHQYIGIVLHNVLRYVLHNVLSRYHTLTGVTFF